MTMSVFEDNLVPEWLGRVAPPRYHEPYVSRSAAGGEYLFDGSD